MTSERLSAADAQYHIRCVRNETWIRDTFSRQLILFDICGHQPHQNHPVYRKWQMDEALRQ
jgi:hypothetical protein